MLTKGAKQELVKEYSEKFQANPFLFVMEYKGLTVKQMEGLRRRLKKNNAELRVIKNTVLKIASNGTEIEKVKDLFQGPTAVAISRDDVVSVAKVFTESLREFPALKLKGGILEGRVIGADEVSKLSKLPPKEVLLSQFVGLIASPVSNFLGALAELERRFLYALSAVKEMKEKEENK